MSYRWEVTTHYRTHTETIGVEELSELHDLIESGPDFRLIKEISIRYAPASATPTPETDDA